MKFRLRHKDEQKRKSCRSAGAWRTRQGQQEEQWGSSLGHRAQVQLSRSSATRWPCTNLPYLFSLLPESRPIWKSEMAACLFPFYQLSFPVQALLFSLSHTRPSPESAAEIVRLAVLPTGCPLEVFSWVDTLMNGFPLLCVSNLLPDCRTSRQLSALES